jgi:DNA-directed RNA polymerase subunit M/transcription elongation factor TFIIS
MSADEKKPFWAKCGACGHCWAAAYLPMEAMLFSKIAKNAAKNCPKCGATKIFVAKQNDGVLLEQCA